MHHDAHLIVLTTNEEVVVRLCDGQPPDWDTTVDFNADTFSMCPRCEAASADLRPVGGQ